MDTSELIKALAADTRRLSIPLPAMWWGALAIAVSVAATVFFATLGPRTDFTAALETPRFLFKFLVTIILVASAFGCVRTLSRPGVPSHKATAWLAASPALVVLAVIAEFLALPSNTWTATMVGTNSVVCLTYIPLIGVGPLAILLLVLRHGAPLSPNSAGAVTGLLAGGIAATFYAAQCNNDSPLFVAVWYTLAIAGLAALGAAGARLLVRW